MIRNCKLCQSPFSVEEADLRLLGQVAPTFDGQRFDIPPPSLCPLCRAQRRYVWRGELHLFRRPGRNGAAPFLTFYPTNSPVQVMPAAEWWSDSWSPLDYGRDFDFSRTFFEQFDELVKSVPLLALSTQGNAENSEYTNCASWNKNCYLLAGANYNEDCYYGNYINHCKSCVDNSFVRNCELCYECVDCVGCYDLRYSTNCSNCSGSYFLANCRNCQDCFGCVNLVGKRHHFYNEPLSPAAYAAKLQTLELHRRSSIERFWGEFDKHRIRFPYRYMIGEMNDGVTGNAVFNSRNSQFCFDASELWDCRYCTWFHKGKNCQDIISWGFPAELCYECMEAGDNSYQVLFSVSSYGAQHTLYSYYTMYSKHCFGCVSVKKDEYCILNKKYPPTDYERMVARIIRHMQETKEWGEFFPIRLSPLGYNTSIAQDYFPIEPQVAKALGARWFEEEQGDARTARSAALPDSIHQIDPSVCDVARCCEKSGKPYKITKQEFEFYKRNAIPVPANCFFERHKTRLTRRNPRQLWERECAECNAKLLTSYSPMRPERIVCESCYQKACY